VRLAPSASLIDVAFLADVHLGFTHTRVSAPRPQPTNMPASRLRRKSMRIVQGQNVVKSDQCSYPSLVEQRNFGIHFLGDLLDAPIVFRVRSFNDSISLNSGF